MKYIMAQNGKNQKITDGNYDKSLAVKCINGTFVGMKADNIISYKGIPFVSQQPVGNLRWKAPVDVTADDGVYEAYYYGKAPVQEVGDPAAEYGTGEDCLYLNVWKSASEQEQSQASLNPADREQARPEGKADEASAKKPVIVWIYGGAYDVGGATDPMYDMTNFLNENPDVIVVTFNYRINVFGFFHLSHLSDGKDYPDICRCWKLYAASANQGLASVFQACHRTKWRSRPDEKYGASHRMYEQPDGETRL